MNTEQTSENIITYNFCSPFTIQGLFKVFCLILSFLLGKLRLLLGITHIKGQESDWRKTDYAGNLLIFWYKEAGQSKPGRFVTNGTEVVDWLYLKSAN